jgi:hypothetical protein
VQVTDYKPRTNAGQFDRIANFLKAHPGEWVDVPYGELVGASFRTMINQAMARRGLTVETSAAPERKAIMVRVKA